jgi:hypothetical protein
MRHAFVGPMTAVVRLAKKNHFSRPLPYGPPLWISPSLDPSLDPRSKIETVASTATFEVQQPMARKPINIGDCGVLKEIE